MNLDRITGSAALVVAIGLYWLASSTTNPDAFLFPRLISVGMGLMGIAIVISSRRPAGDDAPRPRASIPWLTVIPILLAFLAYRWAMEVVGFYVTALCAFVFIVSLYAPDPYSPRSIARRVAVSAVFIGVIYAVFALLLRVQTPQGVLI